MARTILVTGGMGGLGESICMRMADAGHQVSTTCSPRNTRRQEWLDRMQAKGYDIFAVSCDVADYDTCARAAAEVQERCGPVDVLINNAGITRDMSFRRMDKASWDNVIHTNLDSLFNMTRPLASRMAERGWGRIVNISSINGSKGAVGQTNYAAAKAGILGFTRSLALELARKGVTVNAISPGYVATRMTQAVPRDVMEGQILPQIPMGRLGRPEEVAALVTFLASDDAAFITGANIAINGGQYMH